MRKPPVPSLVPEENEASVYLVVDDLGERGRVFPETDAEHSDVEAAIQDLIDGRYRNPVRVIGFNPTEGWARDVSSNVALEIQQRCDLQLRDVPFFLQEFVDRHCGRYHDVQLPLPMRLV
jgi:hypothetical protein